MCIMYACTLYTFGVMSVFVVEMMYEVYKVYNVCLYFITFSIMSAFVMNIMYKVYKILCLYGISGVLSIEAMVEVRVRAEIRDKLGLWLGSVWWLGLTLGLGLGLRLRDKLVLG